ncbi:hypothetical protein TRICI_003417 [Trichomonascus ciferrii]|uniref:PUM-HD domain-containing protein n=1 Tax=Trichomonascus ciferrii TaxID=44093 RepID=A0A642V391_9ASCO|nr:hypothetical protein TRICI_003417 [Trichomonascus ciferrii]
MMKDKEQGPRAVAAGRGYCQPPPQQQPSAELLGLGLGRRQQQQQPISHAQPSPQYRQSHYQQQADDSESLLMEMSRFYISPVAGEPAVRPQHQHTGSLDSAFSQQQQPQHMSPGAYGLCQTSSRFFDPAYDTTSGGGLQGGSITPPPPPPQQQQQTQPQPQGNFLQVDTTDDKFPILVRRPSNAAVEFMDAMPVNWTASTSTATTMNSSSNSSNSSHSRRAQSTSGISMFSLPPTPNAGFPQRLSFTSETRPTAPQLLSGPANSYFTHQPGGGGGGSNPITPGTVRGPTTAATADSSPLLEPQFLSSPPFPGHQHRHSADFQSLPHTPLPTTTNVAPPQNTTTTTTSSSSSSSTSSSTTSSPPSTSTTNPPQTTQSPRQNRRQSSASSSSTRRSNTGGGAETDRFANTSLENMVTEIYTLCKDQHGCRFLQKKLEEKNPRYTQIIFNQTYPHVVELMTDPFGNYLCQRLLEHATDEQRTALVKMASPELVKIALNQHGTRALQKMIEYISNDRQVQMIVLSLQTNVVRLIKDLNGNHVIQKCLNHLSAAGTQFIFDAVCDNCVAVGTHRHGCCVLQRCIDHASDDQKRQLVDEITKHALTLVQDPFGNYVTQYVLDLGRPDYAEPLIKRFRGKICTLSMQKFSSNVIEKCLRIACDDTTKTLIQELVESASLESLLKDNYANYVIQTALDYADPTTRQSLVENIRPIIPSIRSTPYGRRIQSKLSSPNHA